MDPSDPELQLWARDRVGQILGVDAETASVLVEYVVNYVNSEGSEGIEESKKVVGDSVQALKFLEDLRDRLHQPSDGSGTASGKKRGSKFVPLSRAKLEDIIRDDTEFTEQGLPKGEFRKIVEDEEDAHLPPHKRQVKQPETFREAMESGAEPRIQTRESSFPKRTLKPREVGTYLCPGRKECNCQARAHGLVGNCLSCGKIICSQEGDGPCFFCGTPFGKMGKMSRPARNVSKAAEEESRKRKDELLQYDRESSRRAVVYDDDDDYFSRSQSTWISPTERQKAKEEIAALEEQRLKEKSARKTSLMFDLLGRVIVSGGVDDDVLSGSPPAPDEIRDWEEAHVNATIGKRSESGGVEERIVRDAIGRAGELQNPSLPRRPLYHAGPGEERKVRKAKSKDALRKSVFVSAEQQRLQNDWLYK